MLASLSVEERREALDGLTDQQLQSSEYDWRFWARPNQLQPGTPGAADARSDWSYWLVMAGRGFGKTRVGAETLREWESQGMRRMALVGPTAADVRDVMIRGESGLLSCYPPSQRPEYEPSKRLLTWPSGAIALTYSAEEPDRLRGPQQEAAWCDEIATWKYPETWDNLLFGLRLGDSPRIVVTTTPKPVKLMRALVSDPLTVITVGSTYENRSNLAPGFFRSIIRKYEGTRLGRQELNAELLEDLPGALWTRAVIEAGRISGNINVNEFVRVVIAIDPAVTATEESDETGIGVAALRRDGHVVVLEDLSCRETPLGWARIAAQAYKRWRADRIVAEVNNGGDLVQANLTAVAPNLPFRAVHASRGKAVRAEPVAALYEQGRVHHAGRTLEQLEDQLCSFVPGVTGKSPDRMDWLVWAVTDLLIEPEQHTVYEEPEPTYIAPY